ncbi:uncharacterized protein LOC131259288 [Anopheles coustani]|uniref:uncharacterized protein LOC131259288 n=1 Tax=Anopheles coustani TaxID=139045 RepID=UPI00265800F3|nr:uncharacterized protein LOC131259288 [Anopheles coustani]
MGRKAKARPLASKEANTSDVPALTMDPPDPGSAANDAGSRTVNIYRHELNSRMNNLLRELKLLSEIEAFELGKQQNMMKTTTCFKQERESSPLSDQTDEPTLEFLPIEEQNDENVNQNRNSE